MMDTPPIQMITERRNENNVLFLGYFGIVSTEVMPYFFTEMKKIIIKYREYLKWIKICEASIPTEDECEILKNEPNTVAKAHWI